MSKRKAEGCLTVEMECAGLQAVCSFRELQYYAFLFGGDLLDAAEWDVRILGNHREKIARSKASALRWNWRTRYQCYSVWNKDGFIEWIH